MTQKTQGELVMKVTEPVKGRWAFTLSISENLPATGISSSEHLAPRPHSESCNFSLNKTSGCTDSVRQITLMLRGLGSVLPHARWAEGRQHSGTPGGWFGAGCFSLGYGPPQSYFHLNLQLACSFTGQSEKISADPSCVFKRLKYFNKRCSSFQEHRKKITWHCLQLSIA